MDVFGMTEYDIQRVISLLWGRDCPIGPCIWIMRGIYIGAIGIAVVTLLNKFVFKPLREKRKYVRSHVDSGFNELLSQKNGRYYIDACFQNIPPNHFPDIMDSVRSVSSQNMIKKYLADIFVENNSGSPLYCVLGGSGMGKTSFLVNVLKAYVKKYSVKKRPYDIALIDLANESYMDKINSIPSPQNTIILLDALDENPQAVANYDMFISTLEKAIAPFRIVVLTCRTQFFPDEEHEPKQSKLKNNGKSKGFYGYTRHYISPFTDNDVDKYLRKKYRFNFRKRQAANKIVRQCVSFTHRPLLLTYIDSLIDTKKDYDTVLDVYETLINQWLERDTNRQDNQIELKTKLMTLSQIAAIRMYDNFTAKGYCLDENEINILLAEQGMNNIDYLVKGRSLLNRDALGVWKFAHKSFLEFFLAKEYYDNDSFNLDFTGLDDAYMLFKDFCKRNLNNCIKQKKTAIFKSFILLPDDDTIKLENGSRFKIRYLEPFEKIVNLEVDVKMLNEVLKYIHRTRITYIKILNYNVSYSLYAILECPQIKYISITGGTCSKTFVKDARKKDVSILNNGSLLHYVPLCDSDVPIDFLSAERTSVDTFPLNFYINKFASKS